MGKNKKLRQQKFSCWQDIFIQFKELYISAFEWVNVPPTVNTRFLEMQLFEKGNVVFFKDEILGHLVLNGNLNYVFDVYGEPTGIHVYGVNGYQNNVVNHVDSVVIYNNYVRNSPYKRLQDFAKRIFNIERTIDMNVYSQRTPVLIKTSKQQELTMKNIYQDYNEYRPVIIADESIDVGQLTVLKTDAPYVTDKLEEEKRKLWNEALSYIGVENNFSEKSERLTAGEVLVSNGLAIANKNSKLNARQKAVDEINNLFGLDISIKLNNIGVLDLEPNLQDSEVTEYE